MPRFCQPLLALALWALLPGALAAQTVTLQVGFQDQTLPETVAASRVLEGTPYKVEWVTLTGPAAQLSALYSRAIDVGHMGDTSLIIEQGKAKEEWNESTAPLQIIAGWRSPNAKYPPIVTVASEASGIKTLVEVRGKTWAHNFGGYNYLQYTLSILKAGLREKDIESVRLADQSTSAATFNAGRADLYSGSTLGVAEAIEAGKARILINSDELDIPALNVFTARTDVLANSVKKEAIADFLDRVRKHWEWYAANTATVEKILVEKVKQTPTRARLTAQYQQAVFFKLDDDLVRREQRIADVLLQAGVIPKKIDVKIEFNRDFNTSTVASN